MFEQFAASLRSLSRSEDKSGFTPRPGQSRLIDWMLDRVESAVQLCVRWPGGYGKTTGIALCYMILRAYGRVDRLLVVVGNDQQRAQFRRDFPKTCKKLGMTIAGGSVWSFDKSARGIRMSALDRCEIYVTTIQTVSATNKKATDSLLDLIGDSHSWMLAADEYHHYAQEKDWGRSLQRVCQNTEFRLALSATPDRDGNATIFGDPDLEVTYREAVDQCAVKKMYLRRYHYSVTATVAGGKEVEYTTDKLRQQLNDESLSDFEERVGLRYTTNYLHPIVLGPLMRLQNRRIACGLPLQMLVRAMSCRHAKHVCEVISEVAPGLSVDWVGSGPNGRSDEENERIIAKFVPPAGQSPQLDILVQVQKVGEGSDSVNVCEIVDLSLASINGASNQLKQFIFRGSRIIPGLSEQEQYCYVNVGSDASIAGLGDDGVYAGLSLMDWLDGDYSKQGSTDQQEDPKEDYVFTPVDAGFLNAVISRRAELTEVTDDMQEHFMQFVAKMNKGVVDQACLWDVENNPEHMRHAKESYLAVSNQHAAERDTQALIEQRASLLDGEVGRLASKAATIMCKVYGGEMDRSLIGRLKKKINAMLKSAVGCGREEWLEGDFDKAGKILHDWGCAIRDGGNKKEAVRWLDLG